MSYALTSHDKQAPVRNREMSRVRKFEVGLNMLLHVNEARIYGGQNKKGVPMYDLMWALQYIHLIWAIMAHRLLGAAHFKAIGTHQ